MTGLYFCLHCDQRAVLSALFAMPSLQGRLFPSAREEEALAEFTAWLGSTKCPENHKAEWGAFVVTLTFCPGIWSWKSQISYCGLFTCMLAKSYISCSVLAESCPFGSMWTESGLSVLLHFVYQNNVTFGHLLRPAGGCSVLGRGSIVSEPEI